VVTHPNEIEVGSRIAAVVATIPNNAIGLWPLTGYMNEIVGVSIIKTKFWCSFYTKNDILIFICVDKGK
jgi:hypothetical protein